MRICKEVAYQLCSGREDLFLEDVEKRTRIGLNVPGRVHSMATDFWEFALAPLPPDRPSPDLVLRPGRWIHSMNQWHLHPTVEFIINAQKLHGKAIFEFGGWWVMKRWVDGGEGEYFVRLEDAVNLVDMLNAKSEAAVRAVWERPSAGIIERRADENLDAINDTRFQHFTWNLAAVRGDPNQRNLRCICNVSSRAHTP